MKKSELFPLYHGLVAVAQFPGVKFAYAVAKNMSAVRLECECLEKSIAPSEEFVEYDKKRVELAKSLCDKNEDGTPLFGQLHGHEIFLFGGEAESPVWNEAKAALDIEHKAVVDARAAQVDEYNKLLDEPADITLFKVTVDQLPADINAEQLSSIMAIIED